MNNQIIISQATIYDLEALANIFDQYRMYYKQASDIGAARKFLFDRFEHRESVIFIARNSLDQSIQGFTQLYPTFSSISMQRSWILNDLFVVEACRKQGVASALLQHAKTFATLTQAKGIELCTSVTNTTAQRLYESLGYEKDEEYHHYHRSVQD